MKRGRKPVPGVLADLHGNPRNLGVAARALTEPEGVGDLWAPPALFDDEQREVWHYALEHSPPGLLTGTDHTVLALWCVHVVEWQHAVRTIREEGRLIKVDGVPRKHPATRLLTEHAHTILRLCGELGFSPAARVGLIKTGAAAEFYQHDQPPAQRPRNPRLVQYLSQKPDRLQ
jgi:P27 family predicted phage terminase small subunit